MLPVVPVHESVIVVSVCAEEVKLALAGGKVAVT
jgi:hypothetical protein